MSNFTLDLKDTDYSLNTLGTSPRYGWHSPLVTHRCSYKI